MTPQEVIDDDIWREIPQHEPAGQSVSDREFVAVYRYKAVAGR